jgi:hypothetical protein
VVTKDCGVDFHQNALAVEDGCSRDVRPSSHWKRIYP